MYARNDEHRKSAEPEVVHGSVPARWGPWPPIAPARGMNNGSFCINKITKKARTDKYQIANSAKHSLVISVFTCFIFTSVSDALVSDIDILFNIC